MRTLAVGVNHVDTFVRSGAFRTPVQWPLIVGRDLVGEVVSTGADSPYTAGDLVWTSSLGFEGRPGAAAEMALIETGRCYRLPAGVAPPEAVAVFHGASTATLALRRARLSAGEHVFVHGAGGGVGAAVVQIAAAAGARVTATARRPEQVAWLGGLTGDITVVDTSDQPPRPSGVDVHWDCTGTIPLGEAVDSLSPGGRAVVTARRVVDDVPAGQLYLRDLSILGFVLSRADAADLRWSADEVNRLLAEGMRVPVAHTMRLSEAATAHRMVESGSAHGKIVLTPDPT